MKLLQLAVAIAMIASLCCTSEAYVLTFDDVPAGEDFALYYSDTYGINLEWPNVELQDHTASQWGPPHSGRNVLIAAAGFNNSMLTTMFKGLGASSRSVSSFGAFFSTEQSAVLQMVGYDGGLDHPVASVYIGAAGASWHNQYVQISSPAGKISMVEFYPVSADAFHHFCLDDLTVMPVPEPSSLLALLAGLGGFGAMLRRRA